jgi:uncharacterized glyoxalase superfamily protein PhnB
MKPPPRDWPRLSVSLHYDDARAAITWLTRAFGFEVRIIVDGEGGRVAHSELTFGEAVVMVSQSTERSPSPKKAGGSTASMFIYVDDADAHCARARAAGATITRELVTNDYGADYWSDRGYGCTDIEGHSWSFAHRVRPAT